MSVPIKRDVNVHSLPNGRVARSEEQVKKTIHFLSSPWFEYGSFEEAYEKPH